MRTVISSLFVISLFLPVFSSLQADDTVKVAAIFAETGKGASTGKMFFDTSRFAIDEINRAGGLLGKKIELTELDNQSKPIGSKIAAQKAVQAGVIAVIGASWSSNSLAAAPVLQAARIPMISPSSTNPDVTLVGDYIFRVCFLDSFQGTVMADYAFKDMKAETSAVLINADSRYSAELADVFIKRFSGLGGKILFKDNYLQDSANFSSLLENVKKNQPDVIFVPSYPRDSAFIIRQARKMGLKTTFIGGDGWSSRMYEYAGEDIRGNYYSASWHRDIKGEANQAFLENYEKKYGLLTRAAAPLTYDAFMLLADAVNRANTLDRSKIREALASTKNFQGATGNIRMNQNGDPVKSVVILKLDKGTSIFVKTFVPEN